jgi:site-specific recombinase XerD
MAEPEINACITHIAVEEKVCASTRNHALSAFLFLYRHVIGKKVGELGEIFRARKYKGQLVVMTRGEVKAVLPSPAGDKWLMASLMYGAGLRLMDAVEEPKDWRGGPASRSRDRPSTGGEGGRARRECREA